MKKRSLNHSESSDALIPKNTQQDPASATSDLSVAKTDPLEETIPDHSEPFAAASYSPTTVYISGMPHKYCTDAVIEKIMSPYGTIRRCSVHHTPAKLYAFCEFAELQEAMAAIRAVHGRRLGGQSLVVRRAYRDNSVTAVGPPVVPGSFIHPGNPKRQRQQLDSKIAAIKRKLTKPTQQVSPS